MRKVFIGILLSISLLFTPAIAHAETTAPVDVVLDEIGFFTAQEEADITENFSVIAQDYGILPVVEVVQNLGGEDPQRYAIRRANELGIGDANADNGLYILISQEERALRVEPGTGLARVVTQQEIQQVIDQTIIPAFKNDAYAQGVIDGAYGVAEASLATAPNSSQPTYSAPLDFTPLWWILGVLGGLIILAVGAYVTVIIVKSRKEAAEKLRRQKIQTALNTLKERLTNDQRFLAQFIELSSREQRFSFLALEAHEAALREAPERDGEFARLETLAIHKTVDYGNIPDFHYKSYLSTTESISDFNARILQEQPNAKKAYEAALELQQKQAEEARKRQIRKDEARKEWDKLSRKEQESLALANGTTRKNKLESIFADYGSDDRASFYNGFADELQRKLEKDASEEFSRLPRSTRERIAKAHGTHRDQLIEQYVPGYNPALLAIYLVSATSFADTLRAEEARAASYSSSSSSSFGSFDSSSSFSGGSFDGGGGGGSW